MKESEGLILQAVPFIGSASSPAELVAKLQKAAKQNVCPGCGRRQPWIGKPDSLCARCFVAAYEREVPS